VQIHVYS
jgi:hypothetical protein